MKITHARHVHVAYTRRDVTNAIDFVLFDIIEFFIFFFVCFYNYRLEIVIKRRVYRTTYLLNRR